MRQGWEMACLGHGWKMACFEKLGKAGFRLKNWVRLVFGLFRARLVFGFFYTISSHHHIITS